MNREILEIIGELDDLYFLAQPALSDVEQAQKELGLRFADDYKLYVCTGGAICGGGVELTGITDFDRLNVVSVTQKEKSLNRFIPDNMYVVETVGIDMLLVLQDENGAVYTVQPGLQPKKFCSSLTKYIKMVGNINENEYYEGEFSYEYCDEFGQDLVERMRNGLMPILPSGKTVHLHHMGLSMNAPVEYAPIVEFEGEYYKNPEINQTLFQGFDGCSYDIISSIRQKQQHWHYRSKADEISFKF